VFAVRPREEDNRSVSELEAIGGDVEDAIERVRVPAYIIDQYGIIRWLNPAARKIVGDVRGRHLTSVVAPEETRRAQEIFTRNLMGPPAGSDNKGVVIGADGRRVSIEVSAVPLRNGEHVIGVFGQALEVEKDEPPPPPHPQLTPRQSEVLRLLEHGHSTEQIAGELHLSPQTVRNHVQRLLRTLGVHSRLEAVAAARRVHIATG
jgi:PAS domain S-box-containing protein